MNYLERLDIHPKVQSFFQPYLKITCGRLVFNYGNSFEHVSADFHRVPITEEVWIAGEPTLAKDLFITGSAMDAITWLNLNRQRYRWLETLCFIAVGASPGKHHAEIILQHKKLHFIFSNDPLGAICDLKLASFIRDKPLKISYRENLFEIVFENQFYAFEKLSLNSLEKASGYNFRIRTHKPKKAITYYEQTFNRDPA